LANDDQSHVVRELPRFATPDVGWVTANCLSQLAQSREPFCDETTKSTVIAVTTDGGAIWTRIVP
jgi:hypothetical protein